MVWGVVIAVAGLVCIPANVEGSQTFSFSPSPISLDNLPLAFHYTWGITFNLPAYGKDYRGNSYVLQHLWLENGRQRRFLLHTSSG